MCKNGSGKENETQFKQNRVYAQCDPLHPLHKGDDEFSKITVMGGLKSFARNGGKPGMGAS